MDLSKRAWRENGKIGKEVWETFGNQNRLYRRPGLSKKNRLCNRVDLYVVMLSLATGRPLKIAVTWWWLASKRKSLHVRGFKIYLKIFATFSYLLFRLFTGFLRLTIQCTKRRNAFIVTRKMMRPNRVVRFAFLLFSYLSILLSSWSRWRNTWRIADYRVTCANESPNTSSTATRANFSTKTPSWENCRKSYERYVHNQIILRLLPRLPTPQRPITTANGRSVFDPFVMYFSLFPCYSALTVALGCPSCLLSHFIILKYFYLVLLFPFWRFV